LWEMIGVAPRETIRRTTSRRKHVRMRGGVAVCAIAVGALGAGAATAGATTAWTNTPANVESILIDRWNTSDGEPIVEASCRGVWAYPHSHTRRGWEFHRLRCDEWDDVNRYFDVRVVVAGSGYALRVTELWCDDSQADPGYTCP
jgi:hypothetical protein